MWLRTPPETLNVWRRSEAGKWTQKSEAVENFICHNGDLDAFEVRGVTHPLESLMPWLVKVNHSPCPSQVDSCGVAGLIDLVRCQGVWYKAVKFGYIFGVRRQTLDYEVPSKADFQKAAEIFERVFAKLAKVIEPSRGM